MDSRVSMVISWLLHENKTVTYKEIAYKLKIHCNEAKQLLSNVATQEEVKNSKPVIMYFIAGKINDCHHLKLIAAEDITVTKEKFQLITSMHIYCIIPNGENSVEYQRQKIHNSNIETRSYILGEMASSGDNGPSFSNKFSTIHFDQKINIVARRSATSFASGIDSIPVEFQKFSRTPSSSNGLAKSSKENRKVVVSACNESIKSKKIPITSSTTSSSKNKNRHFKLNSKTKKERKLSTFSKKHSSGNNVVNVGSTTNKDSSNKSSKRLHKKPGEPSLTVEDGSEDDDMGVFDDEKDQKKHTNELASKSVQSATPVNRVRRIIDDSDSDSDSADSASRGDTMDVEGKENIQLTISTITGNSDKCEEIETRTQDKVLDAKDNHGIAGDASMLVNESTGSSGGTKRKRRKLMPRTSVDEDGFLVTEDVWVEVTDDEEEVTATKNNNNNTNNNNNNNNNNISGAANDNTKAGGNKKETGHNSNRPSDVIKKKIKPVTKKKKRAKNQSNLMSFFKKKC